MALRVLMLRKKLSEKQAAAEELRKAAESFETREAELATAIEEAATDEEKAAVEEAVSEFESDKEKNKEAQQTLEREINEIESQIKEIEEPVPTPAAGKREEQKPMETRKKFFGLNREERDAFLADPRVKNFLNRCRELGREKRALTNIGLTIPEPMLDLLRENINYYSQLISKVNLRSVSGKARQNIMGSIPEAVWTEMCATLNELSLSFNNVEVDGYKVGGYISVCNAVLEDSDLALASEILTTLGKSIGLANDKAIIYGTGIKMPLGIVTRLEQTAAPSDYPATARPWADLHTSNVITIPSSATGVALYQAIMQAAAKAKSRYSGGAKFWAMNDATYAKLQVEMLSINAAGAIVTGQNMTMPVIGGEIVLLSWMADNAIVGGYGDMYLLAERAGVQLDQSEHYRFVEDQTVFKGTARYDGVPVIPEAFVSIGIGAAPPKSTTFAPDTANP